MNRETESRLLDFCAHQKDAFQESAWLESDLTDRQEMAAVSLFLAGVDWYGHKQQLCSVADRLVPGSPGHFSVVARQVRFDPARFSSMLQHRLRHARAAS